MILIEAAAARKTFFKKRKRAHTEESEKQTKKSFFCSIQSFRHICTAAKSSAWTAFDCGKIDFPSLSSLLRNICDIINKMASACELCVLVKSPHSRLCVMLSHPPCAEKSEEKKKNQQHQQQQSFPRFSNSQLLSMLECVCVFLRWIVCFSYYYFSIATALTMLPSLILWIKHVNAHINF